MKISVYIQRDIAEFFKFSNAFTISLSIRASCRDHRFLQNSAMKRFLLSLLPIIACSPILADEDGNWPRLRGENGSGVANSATIPPVWKDESFAWKTTLPGAGNGSPVVWGDRIFLLSAKPAESAKPAAAAEKGTKKKKAKKPATPQVWMPVCVSATDGSTLWSHEFSDGAFKGHKFNTAASSTPAVDSKRVVFTWGTAAKLTMVAFSHAGEKLWKKDLGPVNGGHGFGASPTLIGDLVVLNNDQEKGAGNLLAVNAKTGELAWTVERRSQRISYSIPCLFKSGDRELLMFTNWQHGFTAIDPKDGSVVADKSVFNTDTNERAISSPILAGNGIVIGTCGFTANPKHCVAMKLNGTELEEIWRIERNVPHIPSPIVVGENAYLWDDAGIITCVKAATGEEFWKARLEGAEGSFFGSPVSDGKSIFCADESGNIHAIAVSTEGLKILGKNKIADECRTTPAIGKNVMFVRAGESLVAVNGL